jgi:hypothetical protein
MNNIYLIPNLQPENVLSFNQMKKTATVEAVYGETILKGSIATLDHHHSDYRHLPAPCCQKVDKISEDVTIFISHLDRDTIGGCLALMGVKPENKDFWEAAAYIDVNGRHHMFKLPQLQQDQLNAWDANFPRQPRYENITHVNDIIKDALVLINDILSPCPDRILESGRIWAVKQEQKIEKCLVSEDGILRRFITGERDIKGSSVNCSAAYYSPNLKQIIPATLQWNKEYGTITLAFEDGGKQFNAVKIMQSVLGHEAGGHPGIAGSPRGKIMTVSDVQKVTNYLISLTY